MSTPYMSAPQPTRRQPQPWLRRRLLWVIALTVVLVAAATTITVLLTSGGSKDGSSGAPFLDQTTPEAAASAFARAATEHDTADIRALTCAEQQDDADRFITYTDYPARVDEGLSKVRMSVSFKGVVSTDPAETTVALSFRYSGVTGDLRGEDSLTDRTEEFEMSTSGGRWFICDDLV